MNRAQAALLISGLLASARIAGETSESFQAVAHLWVGFLLGVALRGRDWRYGVMAVGLSVVELACFLLKGHS
jgi:hypothetical protein